MSILTIARVWERSRCTKASELLMLQAIADHADDDGGNAYPSVATLAAKCRMTIRNANHILAALRARGELEVRANEGPKGTNLYRIVLTEPLNGASGLKRTSSLKAASPLNHASALKRTSSTPEAGFLEPLKPASDESSLNHQEPSDASLARRRRAQPCPFNAIVDSYHEALPDLPRVRLIDAKDRRKKLSEFWTWVLTSHRLDGNRRANDSAEAMAWIRRYFQRANGNDFVMGRTPRGSGHESWEAGLDYLVSERGRIQVIERTKDTS